MFYLYFVLISSLLLSLFDINKKKNSLGGVYFLLVLILIVFDGFKNYYLFSDQAGYEENLLFLDFSGRDNIGFQLLNRFFNHFSSSYTVLSTVIATFVLTVFSITFKKYSPNKWLSLFLFIVTNYIMAMLAIKQYIAMAICLLSIKYIFNRQQIKFIICVALAVSFHTSAAIFLPIYYLYGIDITRKKAILLAIFIVLFIIGFQLLIQYVLNFVGSSYAFYMDNYESESGGEATWNRAIFKLAILLVFIYSLGEKCVSDNLNHFVLCNMILSFMICAGGVGLFGIFRLREFYFLGDVLGIPIMLSNLKNQPLIKKIIIPFFCIAYVVLLFNSFVEMVNTNFAQGYRFIWER